MSSAIGCSAEGDMPVLYVIGGLVSIGVLVYLVVALLKPEVFS